MRGMAAGADPGPTERKKKTPLSEIMAEAASAEDGPDSHGHAVAAVIMPVAAAAHRDAATGMMTAATA